MALQIGRESGADVAAGCFDAVVKALLGDRPNSGGGGGGATTTTGCGWEQPTAIPTGSSNAAKATILLIFIGRTWQLDSMPCRRWARCLYC
jgi:hypothetical protein